MSTTTNIPISGPDPAKGFALFDLDHTLLPHDTQGLFANFILRRHRWRTLLHLPFLVVAPARIPRLVSTVFLKRLFLGYLWRLPHEQLRDRIECFVRTEVVPRLYPELVAELARHRREQRTTILNSASPEFYVREIALQLGFDYAYGTRVDLGDGPRVPWLPAVHGPNNKRDAKLDRMRDLLAIPPDRPWPGHEGHPPLENSRAYSDSTADLPLLRLAAHKTLVHPSASLLSTALAEGWQPDVLRPDRPYQSERGARLASLRQAFGLYPSAATTRSN